MASAIEYVSGGGTISGTPLGESTSPSSPSPLISSPRPHSRSLSRDIVTLIFILLLSLALFRWILLRSVRFLLRDRLHVHALGTRGIRGLHFRPAGDFGVAGAANSSGTKKGRRNTRGYSLRIQQIYLTFSGSIASTAALRGRKQRTGRPFPKAWFTLHLKGVGLQLPAEADGDGGDAAQNAALQDDVDSGAERCGGGREGLLRAKRRAESASTDSKEGRSISRISGLQGYLIRMARPLLYVCASALPVLTRVVDVQMDRVEVYLEAQDVVLRVAEVRAGFQVSMRAQSGVGTASAAAAQRRRARSRSASENAYSTSRSTSLDESHDTPAAGDDARSYRSLAGMLYGMPNRVGSGAKGVVLFLASGLPEGKATIMLEWQGVQAFRAVSALADLQPKEQHRTDVGASEPCWSISEDDAHDHSSTWDDTWSTWADKETTESGSFCATPVTSWFQGKGEHVRIATYSRLLFAPLPSQIEVDVLLGPNFFHLKAHRAFSARGRISECVLGGNALEQLAQNHRGGRMEQARRHMNQEAHASGSASKQASTARALIAAVGSLGLTIERVRCAYASTNADSKTWTCEAAIEHVSFSFSSAQPQNPLCKRWLNTITPSVPANNSKNAGGPGEAVAVATEVSLATSASAAASKKTLRSSLHDRIRRPLSPVPSSMTPAHKDVRLEPRRILHVAASMGKVYVDVRQAGGSLKSLRACSIDRIELQVLSTWTPFGLCPSIRYSICAPPAAQTVLAGNPNESAIYFSTTIQHVALAASASLLDLLRKDKNSAGFGRDARHSIPAALPTSPPSSSTFSLPKVHFGFHLGHATAKLDVGNDHDKERSALVLTIPSIDAALHTAYQDAHVVRTDAARRAAWKEYDKNQLEWDRNCRPVARTQWAVSPALPHNEGNYGGAGAESGARPRRRSIVRSNTASVDPTPVPIYKYVLSGNIHILNSAVVLQTRQATETQKTLPIGKLRLVQLSTFGSLDVPTEVLAARHQRLGRQDKKSETSFIVDGLRVSIRGPAMWNALEKIVNSTSTAARGSAVQATVVADSADVKADTLQPSSMRKGLLDKLPADAFANISFSDLDIDLANIDAHRDMSSLAGVKLKMKCLSIDYAHRRRSTHVLPHGEMWGARSALELPEDAPLMAGALAVKAGLAVVTRVDIDNLRLLAIDPKAVMSNREKRQQAFVGSFDESELPSLPEGHCLLRVPESKIRARVLPDCKQTNVEQVSITAEHPKAVMLAVELANTYLLMHTAGCVRRALGSTWKRKVPPARPAPSSATLVLNFDITFQRVEVPISLPEGVHLFLGLKRLQIQLSAERVASVGFETLVGAVLRKDVLENGDKHDQWSRVAIFRGVTIDIKPQPSSGLPDVALAGDSLVLNVPFNYSTHEIIEGTSVALKATKQLMHEFLLGHEPSAINPLRPMSAQSLPLLSVELRILVLEAEDDPMETRLGLIWRVGRDEARARLERQSAFAQKMSDAMRKQGAKRNNWPSSTPNVNGWSAAESTSEVDSDDDSDVGNSARERAYVNTDLIADAHQRLDAFDSASWIRRVDNARAAQERREEAIAKRVLGRFSLQPKDRGWPINMRNRPSVAPLFRSAMAHILVEIQRPNYGVDSARDFINAHGESIPDGFDFSIFIPMHLQWQMAEWRINIRDYPIPVLHVAPDESSGTQKQKALLLSTDLCIVEQMGGPESTRHIPTCLVHDICDTACDGKYIIQVPKVAMPTKIFGDPKIEIHTPRPVRLCWGQSIQPALSDVIRVFDGITTPPQDPSPKIGFWDKLPLILHGTVELDFIPEGALHLYLKGSRDPYKIHGDGAGWVKCWKDHVSVQVGHQNAEREVIQIRSREYALAIPNVQVRSREVSQYGLGGHDDFGTSMSAARPAETLLGEQRYDPQFQKVVAHLYGGVKWGAGIVLERTCNDHDCKQATKCSGTPFHRKCRFFDRISHWKVITKTREYFASLADQEKRDSFAGWRHDHIHFSLSVRSSSQDSQTPASNSLHVTPLTSAHFWSWIRLFNSALSLPVRQGPIFPDASPRSPKFGFHLATIKYRLDLSPLSFSHIYLQHSPEKYRSSTALYLGLKASTQRFNMDLHQRQQEVVLQRKAFSDTKKVLHKPINEAEVDLSKFELRVVCAEMQDESAPATDEGDTFNDDESPTDAFLRRGAAGEASDQWYDKNDFVELGVTVGSGRRWKATRMRAATVLDCPRFNYHRKLRTHREFDEDEGSVADSQDPHDASLTPLAESKFGDEDSHTCSIGEAESSNLVQSELARQRMDQLKDHATKRGQPLDSEEYKAKIALLSSYSELLRSLDEGHHASAESANPTGSHFADRLKRSHGGHKASFSGLWFNDERMQNEILEMQAEWVQFNNRYLIHSPVMFLSDGTRDILLKYYLSNRSRRGYVHSMTAKALRSVRELDLSLFESESARDDQSSVDTDMRETADNAPSVSSSSEDDRGINLLRSLLRDTMQYINVEKSLSKADSDSALITKPMLSDAHAGIRDDFEVRKSNICVLINPQIVLRSELDDSSCAIVSAMRTHLTNYFVRDTGVDEDDVNEKVMNRNFLSFDKVECWHPRDATPTSGFLTLPLEVLLAEDQRDDAFRRIMPRTDCAVQYDKFNKLRLRDASRQCTQGGSDLPMTQDHLRHNMDLIRIHCPRFSIHADSEQYAALYNIVTDLLLYRDPAHREHAKHLETILFAYNFRDADGLASMVDALQMRIRQAEDLHHQYERHYSELNDAGKADDAAIYAELTNLQNELSLFMEAITVAQDQRAGPDKDKKSALRLEASAEDIAWHMDSADSPNALAELAIHGTSFTWLSKADNSTANTLSIVDLHARNSRPDALFSSIIAKYTKAQDHFMVKQGRILNAAWSVLAPVGGISIIDRFELNVHPLRVQIEIAVGREIMNYIFGNRREREKRQRGVQLSGEDVQTSPKLGATDRSGGHQSLHKQTLLKASKHQTADSAEMSRKSSFQSESDSASRGRPPQKLQLSRTASRASSPPGQGRKKPEKPSADVPSEDIGKIVRDESNVIAFRHAVEMRKRAAANKTFVYVKVSQTVFCLSYKGDKRKSLTDLYDLVFKSPSFECRNRTWAYEDLANSFKRNVLRAAWSQRTTLIKGFLTTRPRRISAKLALRDKIRRQQQSTKVRMADFVEQNDVQQPDGAEDEGSHGEEDNATDVASLTSQTSASQSTTSSSGLNSTYESIQVQEHKPRMRLTSMLRRSKLKDDSGVRDADAISPSM
ncbi:hypothetical protein K437DRAFT_237559 [Tilletiaria anomala UBC 951]|uniref:FMP27 GFWDK domain-containing protein n=1 Tax=Tilletiaria anomala (strain ATCC 24038 / CBS 436.72 / UBC 951) TaxID=1037660 RepID=A0A066VLV0_TILAU|nr:uncharacterized protein K437DRAFT_237559 [Tilletiaria anomala UBC 951]KDN42722.1 hypothetical protein K437DRAFT_237559 [Tilletiaria anomala UBC 951]